MTIDTSREAVERRIAEFTSPSRTYMQAVEKSMGYADLARDLVPALLAERDAAEAEVARLSAPPNEGEVAGWVVALRDASRQARPAHVAEALVGSADALTRLSQALAAETAKREAMEEALRTAETDLFEAEDKFHIASFYISDEQTKQCVMDRVKWMAKAGRLVRETLAQHGKVK